MNEQPKWDFPIKKRADGDAITVEATAVEVREPERTPMTWAAFALAEMCQALDEGQAPDAVFVEVFKEKQLELAEAIDRRIAMRQKLQGELERARKQRADLDKYVQSLKALDDRCDADTMAIMAAHPDLPYKGELGRLATQKNPPSLKLAFGEKGITPDMVTFFAIPPEFIKTTVEINTAAVKDALKTGMVVPWAELKTDGVHLRVRKS